MAKIADELGTPIIRALRDSPAVMRSLREVPERLKMKKRGDRDGVNEIDEFTDAPSGPHGNRTPRNDGRDERGRFVGDGNRPWVDRERIGLDQVSEREGVEIIRDQVASRHQSTGEQIRYYDGLFRNADGTYTGVEVKSGTASRNAQQRLFDGAISVETPAIARLPHVGEIRVVRVILEEVP